MRSLAIATLAASSLFALTPAQAQQGQAVPGSMYAGVSLSQVSYEEEGRGTANPTMISATPKKKALCACTDRSEVKKIVASDVPIATCIMCSSPPA